MSSSFFQPNRRAKWQGYPISDLYDMSERTGDVGLELEFEGNKFQKDQSQLPPDWVFTPDGSLRGQDNAEYKLRYPLKFEDVPKAVTDLWKMMVKYGTTLDVSNRTSVHVHLNVGRFHLNRLAAFSALYLSVEEILTNWCGEHRVGNLFCMTVKDAPAILTTMKNFIQSGKATQFSTGLHYSGFNPHAIQKFGSIEIRTMRGAVSPTEVTKWVSILERIYNLSAEFPDPRNICDHFSGHGPMAYLEFVLGGHTSDVLDGLTDMTIQDVMASLYEGIRYAQDLCYCRAWELYEPIQVVKDPFQRKAKKSPSGGIGLASMVQEYQDAVGSIPIASATYFNHIATGLSPAQGISFEPTPQEEEDQDEEFYDVETEEEDIL